MRLRSKKVRIALAILATLILVATLKLFRNGEYGEPTPTTENRASIDSQASDDPGPARIINRTEEGFEKEMVDRYAISFPNGEEIRVRLNLPTRPLDFPDNLAKEYQVLKSAAEAGDGQSSFLLYQVLNSCKGLALSQQDLAKEIDKMQQTRTVGPDTQRSMLSSDHDVATQEEFLRRKFKQCQGLSEVRIAEAENWLKVSADSGFSPATLRYGAMLGRTQDAITYLESAWLEGRITALARLTDIYRNEWERNGERMPPDYVSAYANLFLYAKLFAIYHGGHGAIADRQAEAARAQLDEIRSLMLPRDLEAALRVAMDMLSTHPDCCQGV